MNRFRAVASAIILLALIVFAWKTSGDLPANAQLGTGGISMSVYCGSGDITIAAQTDTLGGVNLGGWTLRTIKNSGKSYPLSGTIPSGNNVTYRSGPNATGNILSTTNVFSGNDDGAILTTQYGSLTVTCLQGSGLLTTAPTATVTGVTSGSGSITMQVYCTNPGQMVVIGNQTDIPGGINMGGWKVRSISNGALEFPLTGQIYQNQSIIFSAGPGASGNVLTQSNLFDPTKADGAVLISPQFGTLIVTCQQSIGTLSVGITPVATTATQIATTTPTVTVTATPTATVTVTPTVTATATATATLSNDWLSGPPPFGSRQCPPSKQWLLLYWAGGTTQIVTSSTFCSTADLYWVNRTGKWMGFAKSAPGASDSWESLPGEAHFAHGE